jgi:hypothetical protein
VPALLQATTAALSLLDSSARFLCTQRMERSACVWTRARARSVLGMSMGGLGAYMVAARASEMFAAVVPFCGGGKPRPGRHSHSTLSLPITACCINGCHSLVIYTAILLPWLPLFVGMVVPPLSLATMRSELSGPF